MGPYRTFAITLVLSLVAMYLLSMSQIDVPDHFYVGNASNLWMALTMVAAMALIMFTTMRGMFENQRLNLVLYVVFAAVFVGAFFFGRAATFVGDRAFMRSMIPHHSRAILMCQESSISDPEVDDLCEDIIATQRREIALMQTILQRMDEEPER